MSSRDSNESRNVTTLSWAIVGPAMHQILVTNGCLHAMSRNDICTNCNEELVDVYLAEKPKERFVFTKAQVEVMTGQRPKTPESKYLVVERAEFMKLLELIHENEGKQSKKYQLAMQAGQPFKAYDDAYWDLHRVGQAASDLLKNSKPYSEK